MGILLVIFSNFSNAMYLFLFVILGVKPDPVTSGGPVTAGVVGEDGTNIFSYILQVYMPNTGPSPMDWEATGQDLLNKLAGQKRSRDHISDGHGEEPVAYPDTNVTVIFAAVHSPIFCLQDFPEEVGAAIYRYPSHEQPFFINAFLNTVMSVLDKGAYHSIKDCTTYWDKYLMLIQRLNEWKDTNEM